MEDRVSSVYVWGGEIIGKWRWMWVCCVWIIFLVVLGGLNRWLLIGGVYVYRGGRKFESILVCCMCMCWFGGYVDYFLGFMVNWLCYDGFFVGEDVRMGWVGLNCVVVLEIVD